MCPLDAAGVYTSEVTDFEDQYVKTSDKNIMKHLKDAGRVFSQATLQHTYPFCWRSDTPLLYKAVPSWFIKVEEFKDRLLKNNQQTYWVGISLFFQLKYKPLFKALLFFSHRLCMS